MDRFVSGADRFFRKMVFLASSNAPSAYTHRYSGACQRLFCPWALPQEWQRFVICAGLFSFGGICVTMQTASVTSGLHIKYYLKGKLLQTCISLTFALLLCPILYPAEVKAGMICPYIGVFMGAIFFIRMVLKNNSRNLTKSV